MDIKGLEEFFGIKFKIDPGTVDPVKILTCSFEKGPLKFELLLNESERRLWINADPVNVLGNATPAIELNVQYDELEYEKYNGIEKGMMFINQGIIQNLYITKLKDAYSISFSCDTPNKRVKHDAQ